MSDIRDGGPYLDVEQELEAERRRAEVENREPDYSGIIANSNWVPNEVEPSEVHEENPEGDLPVNNGNNDPVIPPADSVDNDNVTPDTENPPL